MKTTNYENEKCHGERTELKAIRTVDMDASV